MFDSITGILVRKDPGSVVLSTGGIGYALQIPLRTWKALEPESELTIYCHLAVKDDAMVLYGFQHPAERDLFRKIMGVSGIGAATAMNLLSEIPPQNFLDAIAKENVAILQSVKKVGARTAKRLVLELKGKLQIEGLMPLEGDGSDPAQAMETTEIATDLVAALVALDYPRNAARDAAAKALATHPEIDDLGSLLRLALQVL